ncbi:helix-turn-helix transcriptional regulator [Thermocoleostomius sinensis]|uniref:Helix-turn-helix transcriptional regulator n=1 Tax=Thermocoleostomius sinensis A174 TaxID=2016057 RepID=A0A9E9CA21_9CYAN|nr:helix-turn-helix transcriptional regulator [Thermocoleostomius sinensis]WAL60377.1 helix-turn-helix transcriptional regulator [Thermocoleostomius sinensis A174]
MAALTTISTTASSPRSSLAYLSDSPRSNNLPVLIQYALEGLMDGIMLLSAQGDLLFANRCAKRLCYQLTETLAAASSSLPPSCPSAVPLPIWRSCQTLMTESKSVSPQVFVIEDEIKTEETGSIRIRAQWLQLKMIDGPCLLVTLEDRQQSAQHKASTEAQKYGLSDRETQVWQLKQAGATYKTIAATLHISEDTVRKHIKSIHAKRDKVEGLSICG